MTRRSRTAAAIGWAALASLLCLAPWSVACAASTGPILRLSDESFRGVYLDDSGKDSGVHAFLGIPFAAPPVGALRWRPPQRPDAVPGIQSAQAFRSACAQVPRMVRWYHEVIESFGGDPQVFPVPDFAEDCLYLNIWRPAGTPDTPLPVIVYLHGGGNEGGWSFEPNYLGEQLARRGVIVVSSAYRLGVLGFFSHPDLQASNLGLLDQIAALEWLREHASAIGADSDRITLMGESSGASNIEHLMVSPLAQGLFQRVIHQSAGWALAANDGRAEQQAQIVSLGEHLFGAPAGLEQWQNVPVDALLAAADRVISYYYADPVIDGHSLLEPLQRSLAEGRFGAVDLLIGSNADEWLMYLESTATLDGWFAENVPDRPAMEAALRAALPSSLSASEAVDRLTTARNYVCPSFELAQGVNAQGARSWFYYFSRVREGDKARAMGAYHGAELPYVFNTHDAWLPTTATDRVLGQQMMSYWVNFARSGDPNGEGLPAWPRFQQTRRQVQHLDARIVSASHPSAALCDIMRGKD